MNPSIIFLGKFSLFNIALISYYWGSQGHSISRGTRLNFSLFVHFLAFAVMSEEFEWVMECLAHLKDQVIFCANNGEIDHGLCWLLRTNATVTLTVPNAVSIPAVLRLSDTDTAAFHRALARKIKDTIEGRFGDDVHVHKYGGVWAVIWKSDNMPENWKVVTRDKVAITENASYLNIEAPSHPRVQSMPDPPSPPRRASATGSRVHSSVDVPDSPPSKSTRSHDSAFTHPTSPTQKLKTVNTSKFVELAIPQKYFETRGDKIFIHSLYQSNVFTQSNNSILSKKAMVHDKLREIITRRKANTPDIVKQHIAAFAATNPQIAAAKIEMLLALGRYSLIAELPEEQMNYIVERDNGFKKRGKNQLQPETLLQKVQNGSPSERSILRWVEDVAVQQAVNQAVNAKGKRVFFQEDGGNEGQNVKFATYWDPNDTSGKNPNGNVRLFLVDVDTTPKSSKKLGAMAKMTGKSQMRVSVFVMATNSF